MNSRLLLQELSPKQRRLGELEFQLYRLEYGLAMPLDRDAIERTKRLIAECEAIPEKDFR